MQTVLNQSNVDTLRQPMFLGDDLSLQRYDRFKYPKFFELWRKQLEFFWTPEEVSLLKDRGDYEKLTETERFIFNSNLRWQTMTDSMLSRSIHQMANHVSNPELEICMTAWANFETIHSYSYTYILNNVTKDSTAFFDSILEDKEILRRAQEISASYNKMLGDPKNVKQAIFDAVLATQITEGLAFYVSFACSFFFGYRGMMEGNAKILSFIARDENLHVAITQNIMKNWRDNPEEGFQDIYKTNEQKVYDTYALAVDNESRWADYLFSKGSLLGLNADVTKGYIQWLANHRLVSMGYKKIYDIKVNPLAGWLDSYTDSSKLQVAPQETEISAYKIGGRNTTIEKGAFKGFEL
jgi:ribonucleotide reductase beta subunit family protein with ferritin-like domain